MNDAVTSADAQTVLPSARPAWRNHSVSNSSAAVPETRKMTHRIGVIAGILVRLRKPPRARGHACVC